MTPAEIIQIVIGVLSLFATVFISFFIYWLQMRHEKEIQRLENRQKQKELEEKAHVFLIENSEERGYLPLCVMAATLHRHDKHGREIYTNFCCCSFELQKEIIRQAEFDMIIPTDTDWVDNCMEQLIADIETHKLGKNYLYDGAKYFHRAYQYYREEEWEDLTFRREFSRIATELGFFPKGNQSLLDYIDEYFLFLYSEYRPKLYNHNPYPPLDYMWELFGLGQAEEKEVCRWMMEAVKDVAVIIHNRANGRGKIHEILTDAEMETFEDKYFETMLWLFYTYNIDTKKNLN